MIKASELRVGNLLHADWDKGRTVTVREIRETKVIVNDNDWSALKHDEVSPVPLTEEWLKRMGLKQAVRNYWEREEDLQFGIEQDDKGLYHYAVNVGEYWMGKPIEFVHQLQNLCFALTGEELTIKETT